MPYFYPFGEGINALKSAFALASVTASFSASMSTVATSASYAPTAVFGGNLNPDQSWELGSSNDGNGWEFFQTRVETYIIPTIDANVTEAFPFATVGPTKYAAKIATRTGTLWKDGNFYYAPVIVGKSYKVSTWVWCDGTLQNFSGVENATCGILVTYLDSNGTPISSEQAMVPANVNRWQQAKATITVPAGVSYIIMAPFLDVPYPNGYGYGSPVCDGAYFQDPLACPGYGWFTGFSIHGAGDQEGTPGTNFSPGPCPSGYIECPNLLAQVSPEYSMVCLQVGAGDRKSVV